VAQGQAADARQAVATAVAMLSGAGSGAVVLVAVLHGPLIGRALVVPAALRSEAAFVIIGTAAVAALEGVFAPFGAGLAGSGRMDLRNEVDAVQRVVSAAGVWLVLSAGWGLQGLVIKNGLTTVAAGLAMYLLLARHAPDLAPARPAFVPERARELVSFGRHIQTVNLGAMVIEPVNKVIVPSSAGLGAGAGYEIASLVAGQVGGGFLALAEAVFPEAAARGVASKAPPTELWRRVEGPIALLAVGAFALLAALAAPFTAVWLGGGRGDVALMIAVLAAGWLVAVLGIPAFLMAQGAGFPALATRASLVTVATSLVLAPVLAGAGAPGVALARSLGLAAGGVAIWFLVARSWGRGPSSHRRMVALTAAGAAGGGIAYAVASLLPPGVAALAAAGVAGAAVYWGVAVALGAVAAADRRAARGLVTAWRR
ncbi:MAG: hypothetical protein ACE5EL_05095, partial [Anaerolineae bacterium]